MIPKLTPEREEVLIRKLEADGHERADIRVAIGRWYEGDPIDVETIPCTCFFGLTTQLQRCTICNGRCERVRIALPKR